MGAYSIKDLERFSGIKAHTIRIWEKRYDVLDPQRTEGNVRIYSDDDLVKVLNLAYLNRKGFKISKLAKFNTDDFDSYLTSIQEQDVSDEKILNEILVATIKLDEDAFNSAWNNAIMKSGFEDSLKHVIFPLLAKIGLLWLSSRIRPYQEHFASHLIRSKVIMATTQLNRKPTDKHKNWVLFLPEGEWHELGLLIYNFIIRKSGHKTYYLGQSVPLSDLKEILKMVQPDFIMTSNISVSDQIQFTRKIKELAQSAPKTKIVVTGSQPNIGEKDLPVNAYQIKHPSELVKFL